MRAPLSIVVPTLDAAADLPATLAALGPGLEAGLIREVVISDGGSGDATCAIAEAAGAVLVTGAAGRGGQLARGAAAAKGGWLMFLHADTRLGPGWPEAVQAHIADRPDRAGYFRLAFRAGGAAPRIVAGWANLRSWLFRLPYGDQGFLVSRTLYEAAGGFRDIALMEDVAMVRALGRRPVRLDAVAHTGAGRYLRGGWFRRGALNLATLAGYFAGVAPERLARFYRRR